MRKPPATCSVAEMLLRRDDLIDRGASRRFAKTQRHSVAEINAQDFTPYVGR
jgi:hypothetical protein